MSQKLEYVVLDLIENAARNSKTNPLNLGGVAGGGGGVGGPPGGFIGWLPQARVAYDTDELAYSGLLSAPSGTLVDNLAHIRYRLNIIESGASITVIDDNTPASYFDIDTIHFSGAGIIVTNLGGGDVKVTVNATSSGGGGGDATYLRLDATNDPLTGQLTIAPDAFNEGGIFAQTAGNAYTADFEQLTTNIDITSSNTLFLNQATDGTGSISTALIEAWRSATGAGIITGDWLRFYNADLATVQFRVSVSGHAYDNGELLITEAPINGNAYERKNGAWVVASGGGISLTVMDYDGSPTVSNVDTIIFSGATISDLGNGDVLVAFSGGAGSSNYDSIFYLNSPALAEVLEDSAYMSTLTKFPDNSGPWSTSYNGLTAGETKAEKFITPVGVPAIDILPNGMFRFYVSATQVSGTRVTRVRVKLYKQDTGGSQTLLVTSNDSPPLTGSFVTYELFAYGGSFTLLPTDRLVLKIYFYGEASGTNSSCGLRYGTVNYERMELSLDTPQLITPSDGWISLGVKATGRSQAYTNDPAAGANIVLNMTDTSGFVVDEYVIVSSSAGSEMAMIKTVTANTSLTMYNLVLNHTTTNPVVIAFYFTTSVDVSAYWQKGTRLKFTQTTTKYATVKSISGTTVKLFPNTDYPMGLSSVAITGILHSNIQSPVGYPTLFAYTPFIQGYSANPTSSTYKFKVDGKLCKIVANEGGFGTSNQVYKKYSAPATSAQAGVGFFPFPTDNGAFKAAGGCKIEASAVNIDFYLSTLANWTNTGTANVNAFTLEYEY